MALKYSLILMSLCLALSGTSAAMAQSGNADLYTCTFKGTKYQFLPKKVLLAKADGSEDYLVSDPIYQYFEEESSDIAKIQSRRSSETRGCLKMASTGEPWRSSNLTVTTRPPDRDCKDETRCRRQCR